MRSGTFSTFLINAAYAATCDNDGCLVAGDAGSVDIGSTLSVLIGTMPLPLVLASDYAGTNNRVAYTSAAAECTATHPELV